VIRRAVAPGIGIPRTRLLSVDLGAGDLVSLFVGSGAGDGVFTSRRIRSGLRLTVEARRRPRLGYDVRAVRFWGAWRHDDASGPRHGHLVLSLGPVGLGDAPAPRRLGVVIDPASDRVGARRRAVICRHGAGRRPLRDQTGSVWSIGGVAIVGIVGATYLEADEKGP
jgi:hypothetical protein